MALTRKFLSALGIEAEKIDEIITAHTETVDGLKNELAAAKADAAKLPGVQKELDDLKAAQPKDGESWETKYNEEHAAFEKYKSDAAQEKALEAKKTAYRSVLKDAGIIGEKAQEKVLRYTDFSNIELDEKGKLKETAKLLREAKDEWPELITTEGRKGVDTGNPPASAGNATMSRAEIYKTDDNGRFVYDAAQRQEALSKLIAEEAQQKG